MLSALFPGAGQVVQGRWVAGLCVGGLFLAFFAIFCVCAARLIIACYRMAFEFLTYTPADTYPDMAGMAASFLLALVVYVVGLLDTARFSRRPPAPPPLRGPTG